MPPSGFKRGPLNVAFRALVLEHPDTKILLNEVRAERGDWNPSGHGKLRWPRWRVERLLEGHFGGVEGVWSVRSDESLRDSALGQSPVGFMAYMTEEAKHAVLY